MAKGQKRIKAEEIALEFPKTGNSPLADKLFKENPLLYKDKEEARLFIRSVRGAQGATRRSRLKPEQVKHFPNGRHNPYDLPDENHNNFNPIIISTDKPIKIGILSDIHFPYQHNQALTIALDDLKSNEVDVIILNGDILDCYMISSFNRQPDKPKMLEEIAVTKNFLSTLRREFPKTRIIYRLGNHEARYRDFLARKSPELFGIEEINLENLLHLRDHQIEYLDNKRLIEAGKLTIVHGHEFVSSANSPVNPARGFYMRSKKSVLGGHHHQVSSHSAKTVSGDQHVAYSVGCLCELNPEYMPINEWSHGFAIVTLQPDGTFSVNNKKILDGKII